MHAPSLSDVFIPRAESVYRAGPPTMDVPRLWELFNNVSRPTYGPGCFNLLSIRFEVARILIALIDVPLFVVLLGERHIYMKINAPCPGLATRYVQNVRGTPRVDRNEFSLDCAEIKPLR